MLLKIESFLPADKLAEVRRIVEAAELEDGRRTGSARLKLNRQSGALAPGLEPAQRIVHESLANSVDFSVFALPKTYRIFFNRYDVGMYYRAHMDQSLMGLGTPQLMRTDLSFTVFLSEPADYDGGEFRIDSPFGEQRLKLPAGSLICYPSDMLHEVEPVTRGSRLAAIGWIQSLVPDRVRRELFRSFDALGRDVIRALPDDPRWRERFAYIREGLLRDWAEV